MREWSYLHAGLRISSSLEIPEWRVFEQPGTFSQPDVRVDLEGVLAHPPERPWQARSAPGRFWFATPDAGEFLVHDGRVVSVRPSPGAGEREVRLYLLGTAWGALCLQRGILALHASVVRIGERVIALCGPSGAGKSSMAAGMMARGATPIADDLCCIDLESGTPRVHAAAPRLKLWSEALDHLGWARDDLARDHVRHDKFHAVLPGEVASASPLPLHAVCVLEWGDLALTRLTGLESLRRLVASATYRPEIVGPMELAGPHWERCARLVGSVPVWELRRPRDWQAMDAALDLLEAGTGIAPGVDPAPAA